jgi:hypothetical protein
MVFKWQAHVLLMIMLLDLLSSGLSFNGQDQTYDGQAHIPMMIISMVLCWSGPNPMSVIPMVL